MEGVSESLPTESRTGDRGFEDTPVKQTAPESRGNRGGRGRDRDRDAEKTRPERSPRKEPLPPVKEARKSAWDLEDEAPEDFDEQLPFAGTPDVEAEEAAEQAAAPKRRRRRRGSRRAEMPNGMTQHQKSLVAKSMAGM